MTVCISCESIPDRRYWRGTVSGFGLNLEAAKRLTSRAIVNSVFWLRLLFSCGTQAILSASTERDQAVNCNVRWPDVGCIIAGMAVVRCCGNRIGCCRRTVYRPQAQTAKTRYRGRRRWREGLDMDGKNWLCRPSVIRSLCAPSGGVSDFHEPNRRWTPRSPLAKGNATWSQDGFRVLPCATESRDDSHSYGQCSFWDQTKGKRASGERWNWLKGGRWRKGHGRRDASSPRCHTLRALNSTRL